MAKVTLAGFLDAKAKFLDALSKASLTEDEKERKKKIILTVRNQLPTIVPYHRVEFAKKLSGESFDATTASLGWFSFKLLLDDAQGEEEKLLQLISNLID